MAKHCYCQGRFSFQFQSSAASACLQYTMNFFTIIFNLNLPE